MLLSRRKHETRSGRPSAAHPDNFQEGADYRHRLSRTGQPNPRNLALDSRGGVVCAGVSRRALAERKGRSFALYLAGGLLVGWIFSGVAALVNHQLAARSTVVIVTNAYPPRRLPGRYD